MLAWRALGHCLSCLFVGPHFVWLAFGLGVMLFLCVGFQCRGGAGLGDCMALGLPCFGRGWCFSMHVLVFVCFICLGKLLFRSAPCQVPNTHTHIYIYVCIYIYIKRNPYDCRQTEGYIDTRNYLSNIFVDISAQAWQWMCWHCVCRLVMLGFVGIAFV
jgi:hypothetical protein